MSLEVLEFVTKRVNANKLPYSTQNSFICLQYALSFIFKRFFFWEVQWRLQSQEGSKCLTVFSNFRQFCWLHIKKGPSNIEDVITQLVPWSTSGHIQVGMGVGRIFSQGGQQWIFQRQQKYFSRGKRWRNYIFLSRN